MTTLNLSHKTIKSDQDLLTVFDMLHDSLVGREDIIYEPSKKTLDIYFERDFFEDKDAVTTTRKFFFLGISIHPVVKTHLQLQGIENFLIRVQDIKENTFQFNECVLEDRVYKLKFCYGGMKLTFQFMDDPIGMMRDLEVIRYSKNYNLVLPW